MKIIEKLLLLVSWFIMSFIGVFVVWGITNLVSSDVAFCSNFPLELSFACASVELLLSQSKDLILSYKFEIFGFAFERLRDILLLIAICGSGIVIFIRVLAKLLRRRRLRLRGYFMDLPGFSLIENDDPKLF